MEFSLSECIGLNNLDPVYMIVLLDYKREVFPHTEQFKAQFL